MDLATLTGAMAVALGDFYAGFFANDDDVGGPDPRRGRGERRPSLALPAPSALPPLRRLAYADMKNSSDLREAGAVLAAEFLKEFAGDGPWAHLDIAGPAFLDRSRGDYLWQPGGSGYGVRLIAELGNATRSLNFDLTEEQQLVRETVRKFARERVAPVAAELDREQRFPYDLVAELPSSG